MSNQEILRVPIQSNIEAQLLFGNADGFLKIIEHKLSVEVLLKSEGLEIKGKSFDEIHQAGRTFESLLHLIRGGQRLEENDIRSAIRNSQNKLDAVSSKVIGESIPVFSKPLDKHLPESEWVQYKGKPDFIFFDGWFCGAKPISEKNWSPPLNELEEKQDPDGVWSKWYNRELSGDYQELFNSFDILLMIKVPSMEHIFESRWIQEKTLEKNLTDPEMKKKIMTKEEVIHFVMHYERLTRYVLEEIPKFADIVLYRDNKFNFKRM